MRFQRILLLLVAATTILISGASTLRTLRSFYQLDFLQTRIEEGLRVEKLDPGSPAAEAGLKNGDIILEIDDRPVNELEDPEFSLAGGNDHLLMVRRENQEIGPLEYEPPPPHWDQDYLARSFVGAFGLFCALIAVFRTQREEAPTFLLLAASALLVGAIPHRTASLSLAFSVLHRIAGMAMPYLLIRFFLIFPRKKMSLVFLDSAGVLATLWAALTPVLPDMSAWWPVAVVIIRVFFTGGLLVGIGLAAHRWWIDSPGSRLRRQIEWAGLGLFVGLVPYGALLLIPSLLGISYEPFHWMAILPMVAVPLSFLAALEEYRLWDLEPITRDLVSGTIVIAMGGLVFLLTDFLLQRFGGAFGNLRNLLAFAAGVIVVVFLQPLRGRVEVFLDRWLYYGRPTPRWLLTNSTRDIATAEDPEELLSSLSRSLKEGLEIEPVLGYLRDSGSRFRLIGPGPAPAELVLEEIETAFPSKTEGPLSEFGIRERLFLERGGVIHGILYLGARRGLAPLGSEARSVVEAFAAQAALGLENARRLHELRRRAEEYRILHANTQRIIESSAVAILVCDAGGRILSSNRRTTELFGLDAREIVGKKLDEYIELPEDWKAQLPFHAENAETRSRQDPPAHFIMALSVLELETGSFNGRVVVLQDVSELRSLQDRVREQERLAALGRFAAGLAHEINTPLTGISSYAQMLGSLTPEEDRRAELVEKIINQSFRVARIVSNLRELVRGSGEDPQLMEISTVGCMAALDAARSLGAEHRLRCSHPSEGLFAWAAEGAIELALANLIRNAIEASPPDTPVELEFREESGRALILVRDRGPGVPEEIRPKVFDAFVTTKTEGGGTGLGLAITRDMISRLGGKVSLRQLPEGGTEAVVELKGRDGLQDSHH